MLGRTMCGAVRIRFLKRLSDAAMFVWVARVFVTSIFAASTFVGPIFEPVLHGDEPAQAATPGAAEKATTPANAGAAQADTPEKNPANGQASDDEDVRSFAPVEPEPDPLPGNRLPLDRRIGESPFLSNSYQQQIALWILLVFAVMLLLSLVLWRQAPKPEDVETPTSPDAPSYEEVLAAAAERERIKQMTHRR